MARETVKFDHIAPNSGDYSALMPDGYAGFTWTNMYAYDDRSPFLGDQSGYKNVIQSGHGGVYNGNGLDGSFSSTTDFSLKSLYLCAAFSPETVTFYAYSDGVKVAHKTVSVDNLTPTFVHFGKHFAHIDEVVVSTGGEALSQMAMDNMRVVFDGPIPGASDADLDLSHHVVASALESPGHHADGLLMLA